LLSLNRSRERKDGYSELAAKVAKLLGLSPMIARSLAQRYPIIVCDEHQDANADQEALILACHNAGASVRLFGDPMQRIYGSKKKAVIEADMQRWETLKKRADRFEILDKPHRWSNGSEPLGYWILAAREALRSGGQVDLRGVLPAGISVRIAENQAPRYGVYSPADVDAKSIRALVRQKESILILSAHNSTVDGLNAFFGRRVPIWEGHVREGLSSMVGALQSHIGNAEEITKAVIKFMNYVATGFSPSAYGNALLIEVCNGCVSRRSGKPAKLQALGRILLTEPDHKGVARFLRQLESLASTDADFANVKVDCRRELWDAVRLGEFENPAEGFAEISRRRSSVRQVVPAKSLSTVHKAKGLECRDVLIIPCDSTHFGDSYSARCRFYVALSRATRSLTIVVSLTNPSPLILV
jgi:UvrD/REP helicase N-terminal domain/UvrD-like helicase C-terminal domain